MSIYQNGVERPLYTSAYAEPATTITCSTNPARLYGYNGWTTQFGFRRFDVSDRGITRISVTPGLISGFKRRIEFDSGLIFASSGTVLEPESLTVVTNIPDISANALCKPDTTSGRLTFLTQKGNDWFLRQYAHSNYSMIQEFLLPGVQGQPKSLTRWGTDGLAFLTSSNQMFLVRPSLPFDVVRLNSPRLTPLGSFEFMLQAVVGGNYLLESSTNLTTWRPEIPFIYSNSTQILRITNSPMLPNLFFRLRTETNASRTLVPLLNSPVQRTICE
jgi:hypothetical protein